MILLHQYEEEGDKRVLPNKKFKSSQTFIGYATEKKDEFHTLIQQEQHHYVVFTDRVNIPDMERVQNTLKVGQVKSICTSNTTNKWKYCTSFLPCSCENCRTFGSSNMCLQKNERNVVLELVKPVGDHDQNDPFKINSLTVPTLRFEFRQRSLITTGRKKVLVDRLMSALIEEGEE